MKNIELYEKNDSKWNKFKLGEVISYKKGYAFKSENYKTTGIRVVKISDTTESSIKDDSITCIDCEKYDEYKEWVLIENDIIITTVGSRPPLYDSMVGKAIKVPSSCNNALLNQNMVRLRAQKNLNQKYLYYLLKTRRYLNHIENICRGNANQVSITLDELFDYKVDIPPVKEQEKIAEILSTWDLAIEKQEQLIEKKKEFKKGLMQRLLSGEVRFKEFESEWSRSPISKIAKVNIGKTPDRKNNSYWGKGYKWLSIGDMKSKNILRTKEEITQVAIDECNMKVVPRGTLVMSFKLTLGKVAILNEDMYTNEAICNFNLNKNIINRDYLYYYLDSIDVSKFGSRAAKGITLNQETLSGIIIKYPCLEEQNKIADVLMQSDKEIELLEKELEALKLQKKGLMQRLLTGEVRVKV